MQKRRSFTKTEWRIMGRRDESVYLNRLDVNASKWLFWRELLSFFTSWTLDPLRQPRGMIDKIRSLVEGMFCGSWRYLCCGWDLCLPGCQYRDCWLKLNRLRDLSCTHRWLKMIVFLHLDLILTLFWRATWMLELFTRKLMLRVL